MSNLFNVNSGSIDNLVVSSSLQALEKITIKDKNVEELLVLDQYGSLYFDTSNDTGVDPGSNNFRIGANSWDQQSTAVITISLTNIDATKQSKYLQLLNTLSSTGVGGYQIQLTSATDTSTYKRFEIINVEKVSTYIRFWVNEIASGWNALRVSQLPNDGEEFTVGFDVPAKQVQRFEFTTNQGTNKVIYGVSASVIPGWTPPVWTNKMTVICVGAGGGGGGGAQNHPLVHGGYFATGGGGGAGGNIAITEFTRNEIFDTVNNSMFPIDIFIGKGGKGGEGGYHEGAHLIMLNTPGNFVSNTMHNDLFKPQLCHQTSHKVGEQSFVQFWRTGNEPGQIFRRDIVDGHIWYEDYTSDADKPKKRVEYNTLKYGRRGTQGGLSAAFIRNANSTDDSIIALFANANEKNAVIAAGGKAGQGGWASDIYCSDTSYKVDGPMELFSPETRKLIQNSPDVIRGGETSKQFSLGNTVYLGGPGGVGSIPPNPVKHMHHKGSGFGTRGWALNYFMDYDYVKSLTWSGEDDVPITNVAVAPAFPWGKEITAFGIKIWEEKDLPFNGSVETPSNFGCPGGGGGAGTSFHPMWDATRLLGSDFGFAEGISGGSWWDLIHISDFNYDYKVHTPEFYWTRPDTQITWGGANTAQTEIYGIPVQTGGAGGWFQQEVWLGGSGPDANSKKFWSNAYIDVYNPSTGSGYGVGGGGGAGWHKMNGLSKTKLWYLENYKQNCGGGLFGLSPAKTKEAIVYPNDAYVNKQYNGRAQSGAKGNDGIVVIICES